MIAQLDSAYVRTRPARAIARLISYALFEGRALTTRGRWLNPLLKSRAESVSKRTARQPVAQPVFILGSGRTGTTVLGKILSLHRSVGYLNEPKLLWHVAYPNEDLNGNYSNDPARYRLDATDAIDEVCARMHNLYGHYLSVTGNTRVVDKYPELVFRTGFVRKIFPDARFIVLARNGFDVCRSVAAWSGTYGHINNGTRIDWWGTDDRKWRCLVDQLVRDDEELGESAEQISRFGDATDKAAVEWMLSTREGLKVCEREPDTAILVRYETLVQNPGAVITGLLDFCGLEQDATVVEYAVASLQAREPGPAISLHPVIRDYFLRVMSDSGYTVD